MTRITKTVSFLVIFALTLAGWNVLDLVPGPGYYSRVSKAHALDVGTLHVIITPQEAIDDGAQWRVDGGTWHNSNVYLGIEVGSYTVEYEVIDGWDSPPDEVVDIIQNQTTEITGTYSKDRGALLVTLMPRAVVDLGAQWNVDGGTWQDSGATVSGLGAGEHTG